MYLNPFPTESRRELTKTKIFLAQKAKEAELERLRASFAANHRAESEKLDKVHKARMAARNRSTDVMEARKALMDAYTPSSRAFVLKLAGQLREKELEEIQAQEKAERIRLEKQKLLENFRARIDAMVRAQKKGKDATSRAESAEVSLE